MHEMSITRSILEIVGREMTANSMSRLKKLKVRVGELTAVEPEALRFCFDAAIRDTRFEGAALEIVEAPLTGRCAGCSNEFRITAFARKCPACGSTRVETVSGDELDIISMEGD